MQKIGFFGGCFNPPTNIHIQIVNNLIKQGKIDKVVFIPVNDYYIKKDLVLAKHRYNMLKLAIKNNDKIEVDDIELKENKDLYAVDAFEIITKKYKNNGELFLIMGSDNFNKMPTWKEYESIKDKYKYIVIDRDKKEISATQIREMIKNNDKNVIKYLSEEVYNYIVENGLYKI